MASEPQDTGREEPKPDHDCTKESGVVFPDEAKGLSSDEIRERYPRKRCPRPGCNTICYASYYHYIAGDW